MYARNLILHLVIMLFVAWNFAPGAQENSPQSDQRIVQVMVVPAKVYLFPGEKVHLQFIALDGNGKEIPAAFTWRFSGGSLERNGWFTAGSIPGTYSLTAAISTGVKGTATIIVRDKSPRDREVAEVKIFPTIANLAPGETCHFAFSAVNRHGWPLNSALQIGFSGGEMDTQGNYRAGNRPGRYQVTIRTANGKQARAQVIIGAPSTANLPTTPSPKPGEPALLEITPNSVVLQPGQQCNFQFAVCDAQHRAVACALSIAVSGGRLENSGRFTAGKVPGIYHLQISTANGLSTKAKIEIVGPSKAQAKIPKPQSKSRLEKIQIIPASVKLKTGESCHFRFIGIDTQGKVRQPKISIKFSGGKLSNDGRFTAGQVPGKYQIIADNGKGLRAVSKIEIYSTSPQIRKQPGPPVALTIVPNRVRLRRGESCKFAITAVDSEGRATPGQFSWSYRGGKMKSDGTYIAYGFPGQYYVSISSANQLTATAIVAIIPEAPESVEPYWISLHPTKVSLRPGQTCQFRYSITDDANNAVHTPPPTWEVVGGTFDSKTQIFTANGEFASGYVEIQFSKYLRARAAVNLDK